MRDTHFTGGKDAGPDKSLFDPGVVLDALVGESEKVTPTDPNRYGNYGLIVDGKEWYEVLRWPKVLNARDEEMA